MSCAVGYDVYDKHSNEVAKIRLGANNSGLKLLLILATENKNSSFDYKEFSTQICYFDTSFNA